MASYIRGKIEEEEEEEYNFAESFFFSWLILNYVLVEAKFKQNRGWLARKKALLKMKIPNISFIFIK